MKKTTKFLVRSAVIAALYATLTLVVYPLSYGPIQVRVSEAMTVLPLFFAEAIPGLTIGCFLANIPMGLWDMVIGATATLLASVTTRMVKKVYFGVIPPVIFNALLVPVIFLTMGTSTEPYWINALTVGAGELISVLALGVPLYFVMKRTARKYPSLIN